MLHALGPLGRAEIERALLLDAASASSAAQQRVAELGAVAEMLHELRPPVAVPRRRDQQADAFGVRGARLPPPGLAREDYDTRRPLTAPTSELLVHRYGSWAKVRRAAYGLLPDGRYVGPGRPWAQVIAPERIIYTCEDCASAIRRCALDLGRLPSSGFYYRWQRATKARLRPHQYKQHRIPGLKRILDLHDGGWSDALAAARVSEADLVTARAQWAVLLDGDPLTTGVRDRLAELPPEVWRRLGLLDEEVARVREAGAGELLFDHAVTLSCLMNGSLDWLAGLTPTNAGAPAADTVFSPAQLRASRVKCGLTEAELARAVQWPSAALRRLVRGAFAPTLEEAAALARATGVSIHDLCVAPEAVAPNAAA